ncbi:MAG TPA: response regulator [Vicinamibacterales bacterium]|jgi:CheY-like chemotaxis protein
MPASSLHDQTGNVLIVEDDADMRELLSSLVTQEGFHAVSAEDGLEALHVLRTVRRRAPTAPCLILLDLAMPRLSGTAFRRAQLDDPSVRSVPVAILSGDSDRDGYAHALGAVASVGKPFDVDVLLKIVKRYCA